MTGAGRVPVLLGPLTGTGQVPFARLPFGKGIVLPGIIQALSAIGWIAIGALFGAQAARLLLHIPFWLGAVLVVAATMAISIRGYEAALQAQKYGAIVMPVLFGILTIRLILSRHLTLAHDTVHAGTLAGTFILMVTIAASGSFSWLPTGRTTPGTCPSAAPAPRCPGGPSPDWPWRSDGSAGSARSRRRCWVARRPRGSAT